MPLSPLSVARSLQKALSIVFLLWIGIIDCVAQSGPPIVSTGAPGAITATSATLNGTVSANGASTTVAFNYGPTTSYGSTATAAQSPVTGVAATPVSAMLAGLTCNTTYHYQVVGQNSVAIVLGADESFTTSPCVPGAPTIGTATAGDSQASVTFTAPSSDGGAPISGYTVVSSPGNISATGISSPIVVGGLNIGTAYTFRVYAMNSAGNGPWSGASNSVTPKAAQTISFATPSAQNFGTTPTLTAIASSGLTPTFTSSTTGVCTITSGGVLTFVSAGSCTINADQAGNAAYSSAPTVSRTFTVNAVVPGAPTIGTVTTGNTTATVHFTAPAFTGGSAITGYVVTSSPGSLTAAGNASPITVTGLNNLTAYTFTVQAVNSVGTGPASGPSTPVTPGVAPVANPVNATVAYGSSANVITPSVSGAYTSVAVASQPAHGTTTVSGLTLVYTPAAGFSGTDGFTYTATNASGTSTAATVTITVASQPPIANAVSATVPQGSTNAPIAINVTGGSATSVAVVTLPSHGTATANGTSIAYTPANGYSGTDIFTYTATNSGGTSSPATVTITVGAPIPVAGNVTLTLAVNSRDNVVPLSLSGGTPTSVAVATAPAHGTASVSGTTLTYTPTTNFYGTDTFTYAATNASGTSAPATVTLLVHTRPDPTKDTEVTGLINAQVNSAERFAQAQISNVQSHLEGLHRRARQANLGTNLASSKRGVGSGEEALRTTTATPTIENATSLGWVTSRTGLHNATSLPLLAGAPLAYRQANAAVSVAGLDTFVLPQTKTTAGSADALPSPLASLSLSGKHGDVLGNGLEVWTGGIVNLGKQGDTDTRFTTSGISVGADQRFSEELTLGLSAGFGHERQTIGDNGTRNTGNSYSVVAYGSYQPSEGYFVDALLGYGRLDFDATRYVSTLDDKAQASRRGAQWFTSISGGYDYLKGKLLLSNYGRLDVVSTRLERSTETDGGIYNLTYFDQSVTTTKLSFGVRGEMLIELAKGTAKPYFRVEYQHNLSDPKAAKLAYADALQTVYQLDMDGTDRNTIVLGMGGELMLRKSLSLGLSYRYSYGSESTRIQSLGFQLKQAF